MSNIAARRGPVPLLNHVDGFAQWAPPLDARERALVLGGGGATGVAWEIGVILGLRDEGVDIRDADTIIGTSAGSIVGSHLRLGTEEDVTVRTIEGANPLRGLGRLGTADGVRFVRAQLTADRRRGRSIVGRSALEAATMSERDFIEVVADGLQGASWPDQRLLITAVDAQTGTAVVFDRDGSVPLARAVAASCAVPGVFPPVEVAGRRYVDGGLRASANADLAVGHARVLALAPLPIGPRPADLPRTQLRRLRPQSRTLLVVPDAEDRAAMGYNVLDTRRGPAVMLAAREHGRRVAERVARLWSG